jgi:predicted TIM-barrel fold metal-dependent hydrolase
MDRHRTATAVLSGTTFPEPLNDGTEKARTLARRANEFAAGIARDHPGRFGFFAAVPLADTEGSLREIEYAFDTLGADGVTMNSSAAGMWPGDPSQMPVFEELDRRKTAVFLHPNTTPTCCMNPPGVPLNASEFDNDVNRAVLSLLWNGVLTNCPDINFIVSHSGGTVPVLAGRIQDRVPENRPDLYPYGTLDKLRRLYYEIGHASFPWVVASALEFAGPSQLLFGTDFAVEPYEVTTRHIPALKLPPDVLYALERGNAERIFPRHRA